MLCCFLLSFPRSFPSESHVWVSHGRGWAQSCGVTGGWLRTTRKYCKQLKNIVQPPSLIHLCWHGCFTLIIMGWELRHIVSVRPVVSESRRNIFAIYCLWYVKRSVTKIDIRISGEWASVEFSLHQLQTWRASSRGHCAARWCAARRPRRARRPACSSCSSTPAPPAAAPCRYLTGSRISQQPPWVYCHIFNMLIYFPKIFAICYKKIFTVLLIL